ncbi:MAG: alpha-L-rhamnosidase C-terminal domain-containing protein [Planctomycetia bacterium]|nr:alpha-L-rhamnosidase C-terminal domain-containing protein [Planctomycetia bacterium]
MRILGYWISVLMIVTVVACHAEERPMGNAYPPVAISTPVMVPADVPADLPNLWMVYRKTVSLEKVPEKALARIAADSKYWLYVNGENVVWEGGLKRGPAPNGSYFDVVDLKPFLKPGKNTVAVLVWYFGKSGFSYLTSGQPGLLFDASNGENGLNLVGDSTWKAALYSAVPAGLKCVNRDKRQFDTSAVAADWREKSFGPYEILTADPQPNYRLPEWNIRFDARYDFAGDWKATDFDDSSWADANTVPAAAWGFLYPRPIPFWKDYGLKDFPEKEPLPAISTGQPIALRLPYNAQVVPWLSIDAKAGLEIDIRMDNYKGGSVENVRTEYVTKEGVQTFESTGWMNGHVMIFTIPAGVKILGLKYRETGYDAEFGEHFACSDPFYTRLWNKAVRTLYITMRDTYFDCPDRERAQWWGDAVNELGEAFYCMDRRADLLPRKGFYELIRHQHPDGSLHAPIPGNYTSELPAQMLATIGKFGLGTYSFYSGDAATAADLYPGVKKYLDLWEFEENGLVKIRRGGWSWGDWGENIDLWPLLNCWYYLAAMEARDIARSLNLNDDADRWQKQMDGIAAAFNTTFWTGKDYRDPNYKGRSDDRTNAMAVLCGFPKPEWYPLLREHFRHEKNASPYMEKYVLEAICVLGYADDALFRMKERFSEMVNAPYTTLWEGWGIGEKGFGGGTINHAWSGGGLTCLAQYIVGLTPTQPAFQSFAITPQLGGLEHARLAVPTHYGTIAVELTQTAEYFAVELVVPQGTSCQLAIPDAYAVPSGKPFHAFGKDYTRLSLNAGTHSLRFEKK